MKRISHLMLISLVLVSLCVAGCFAGCGKQVSNDTASESTDTNNTNDTSKEDTSSDEDSSTSNEPQGTPDQNWKDDGKLKILTIGNSFSDDTMQYVYHIAQSLGVESISLGNLYIGGCSLNTHAENARANKGAYEYRTNTSGTWTTAAGYKMSSAIKAQNWDFISLQQASGSSGIESTYAQLDYLINYVQSLCPDAKIVWNMTWAYQQNSTHNDFAKYNKDQMTMFNAIVNTADKKIKTNHDIYLISPTGTAIQNARTSYIGDNLTRDGYHLTRDLGRYIAGLTFVSKLTGLSVENVGYAPEGVDENMKKVAIEAAVNATKEPGKVTKSEYTVEPAIDYSNYTKLELVWTPHGYWYSSHSTNHHKVVTTASNSGSFYATEMLTRDRLPVGSIIELSDGWQYRPEAWKDTGVQSSRPAITSSARVIVTEQWWADYTHRAFNLSKKGSASLKNTPQSEIDAAFVIWIPKK